MTVRELYELLGELLPEHGEKEIAHNYGHGPQLYRITGASLYQNTGSTHDWPTFVRLGDERWNDAEWHAKEDQ